MQIPKKYFHDRVVLLLLTVNTFLALLGSVLIILNIDLNRPDGYIVQYRANLGLSAYKAGDVSVIVSFMAFMLLVVCFHWILSMKMYAHRRNFAVALLGLGTVLLVVATFVSNALLEI